jgi:hypothetical protein
MWKMSRKIKKTERNREEKDRFGQRVSETDIERERERETGIWRHMELNKKRWKQSDRKR